MTLFAEGANNLYKVQVSPSLITRFEIFPLEHIRGLHELIDYYDQEAREYHQRRDTKKADLALTKKKLAMKEVNAHNSLSSNELLFLLD